MTVPKGCAGDLKLSGLPPAHVQFAETSVVPRQSKQSDDTSQASVQGHTEHRDDRYPASVQGHIEQGNNRFQENVQGHKVNEMIPVSTSIPSHMHMQYHHHCCNNYRLIRQFPLLKMYPEVVKLL